MKQLVCIICPQSCRLTIGEDMTVSGGLCKRGASYAQAELTAPMRVVTGTVRTDSKRRLPVRTNGEVPKDTMRDIILALRAVTITGNVRVGDVVLANVCNTGVDVIATDSRK